MYFKRRFNCFFQQVSPHRSGVILEVKPELFAEYLGTIDRSVARLIPGAREISLGYAEFAGWRLSELDRWQWISDGQAFVGCLINQGVFAVIDRQKPLIKKSPVSTIGQS
ncbi:hypothetical protein [Marinobacter salarius]|uniref:Uncharacterized protein n=1 Tax=Marinobacter salarius TaxID=1420917 RepID=A0A1W6KFY6_9GAMM|nr:hypothetical protein [Marinobacter salarius]ARM86334.1 hypothetical protein MARSALSMR5_04317 [Marinobacter salarius]